MTITQPTIWADSRLSLSLVSVSRPYLGSDDFSRQSSRPRLFGRYPALSRGRVSATSRSFLVRLTLDHSCSAAFRPSLGYRRSVGCHSLGRPSSDARLSLSRVSVIIPPSRDRVSAIIWLTCVTSGRFCVIFVWLLTDHLSDQPRLVGCLSELSRLLSMHIWPPTASASLSGLFVA